MPHPNPVTTTPLTIFGPADVLEHRRQLVHQGLQSCPRVCSLPRAAAAAGQQRARGCGPACCAPSHGAARACQAGRALVLGRGAQRHQQLHLALHGGLALQDAHQHGAVLLACGRGSRAAAEGEGSARRVKGTA